MKREKDESQIYNNNTKIDNLQRSYESKALLKLIIDNNNYYCWSLLCVYIYIYEMLLLQQ